MNKNDNHNNNDSGKKKQTKGESYFWTTILQIWGESPDAFDAFPEIAKVPTSTGSSTTWHGTLLRFLPDPQRVHGMLIAIPEKVMKGIDDLMVDESWFNTQVEAYINIKVVKTFKTSVHQLHQWHPSWSHSAWCLLNLKETKVGKCWKSLSTRLSNNLSPVAWNSLDLLDTGSRDSAWICVQIHPNPLKSFIEMAQFLLKKKAWNNLHVNHSCSSLYYQTITKPSGNQMHMSKVVEWNSMGKLGVPTGRATHRSRSWSHLSTTSILENS